MTPEGEAGGIPVELTPADKEALAELEFHWGGAYVIGRDGNGTWWAARRDRIGEVITATSAEELHALIRADYNTRPVPREAHTGDAS